MPFSSWIRGLGGALLCGALLLGGCSPSAQSPTSSSNAPQSTATVIDFPPDDLGRPINLTKPAKRVVIIGPGAIETAFAIGGGQAVVGRDSYADFPPQAKKIAVAGDFMGPNVEQSLALHPDLVIVQGETWDKARIENWQSKIGAPVAALTPTDIATLAQDIQKIGNWLGHAEASQKIAVSFTPFIQGKKENGPTILVETGRSPLWVAGKNTFIGDAIESSGGQNAAAVLGITGYKQLSLETLLAKQPDYYLVASKRTQAQELADLRANTTLSKLKCVQTGKVLVLDGDLILRPGPRLLQGMEILKKALQ